MDVITQITKLKAARGAAGAEEQDGGRSQQENGDDE